MINLTLCSSNATFNILIVVLQSVSGRTYGKLEGDVSCSCGLAGHALSCQLLGPAGNLAIEVRLEPRAASKRDQAVDLHMFWFKSRIRTDGWL